MAPMNNNTWPYISASDANDMLKKNSDAIQLAGKPWWVQSCAFDAYNHVYGYGCVLLLRYS